MPLDLQFYTLFVMIVTGVAAGVTFDLFRAVRTVTTSDGLAGDVWDLLFWATLTLLVSAGLVIGNWGNLRLSILLGTIVGLWLYMELASDIMYAGLRSTLLVIGRVAHVIANVTLAVIIFPLNIVVSVGEVLVDFALTVVELVLRFLTWLLRPLWTPLYLRMEPQIGYYRHRLGPFFHLLRHFLR